MHLGDIIPLFLVYEDHSWFSSFIRSYYGKFFHLIYYPSCSRISEFEFSLKH